jgi:hypothetical protein
LILSVIRGPSDVYSKFISNPVWKERAEFTLWEKNFSNLTNITLPNDGTMEGRFNKEQSPLFDQVSLTTKGIKTE